ncbi:PfkB family carbohydrate kinase [Undibacterium sp. Jales W-56]|uniref:PfkB family carbohydrate kinase n=1 Tax=Undibacterium sp. Jales W-56 TaxID=2897325 RepID=UPI0021CF32F7|nr:PfkB family carbohydrate kinase [Undibacterium sp. Jales W-56]MCU6432862.1 PfkB family carbohydrate kinase [Undibacterium sp. Jales W-56]
MKPIVIFGEALIDDFPDQQVVGGAAFNVARTLGYFGANPLMISRIGSDANACLILRDMQRFCLQQDGMQTDMQHPTGRVEVRQDDDGNKASHHFEIMPEQAYDYIDADTAVTVRENLCPDHDAGFFYFGTLAQRMAASRSALYALLEQTRALKYLDLNLRAMQVSMSTIDRSLHAADILKINEEELLTLVNIYLGDAGQTCLDTKADARSWQGDMSALMTMFKLRAILVTLGARGYAYFDRDGEYASNDGVQISTEVVDTVGGGDAFSAIFLLGLQQGWALALTLQRAHQFAAAICGVRGAVAGDAMFYQQWQTRWTTEIASKGATA